MSEDLSWWLEWMKECTNKIKGPILFRVVFSILESFHKQFIILLLDGLFYPISTKGNRWAKWIHMVSVEHMGPYFS